MTNVISPEWFDGAKWLLSNKDPERDPCLPEATAVWHTRHGLWVLEDASFQFAAFDAVVTHRDQITARKHWKKRHPHKRGHVDAHPNAQRFDRAALAARPSE